MTSRPLDFESSAYASSATSAGPAGMVQPPGAGLRATSNSGASRLGLSPACQMLSSRRCGLIGRREVRTPWTKDG